MRFSTVTLWVDDPGEVADWYVEHLGLHVVDRTPRFVQLRSEADTTVAFHVGQPVGRPEAVQLHFTVPDVDAAFEELSGQGLRFHEEPTDRRWGVRSASLSDPAGHSVELVAPLPASA